MNRNHRTIYLAGGCFWGVEAYFKKIKGIINTEVGYANGQTKETTYQELKQTGHSETVRIEYDYAKISLTEILLHYFNIIDAKSLNKQGNDQGLQYRTGIYYVEEGDLAYINKVIAYEESQQGAICVEVQKLNNFIEAEDYHQDYLDKNPNGYCHINLHSTRQGVFNDYAKYQTLLNEAELLDRLDDLSYKVLRLKGTEKPHTSELNKEHRRGIYVDKITGEPLFASQDKFDAGCGWPSFSKPILSEKINYETDYSHGMIRTEVRSQAGDNHLGHVFNDGPKEMGGLRYCINGAALKFIPYEEMVEQGYGDYLVLCE